MDFLINRRSVYSYHWQFKDLARVKVYYQLELCSFLRLLLLLILCISVGIKLPALVGY